MKKYRIFQFNYIKRIVKYSNCEENTLILSLIYLDKICLKNIKLSYNNIHRFIFTSLLLELNLMKIKYIKVIIILILLEFLINN